MHDLNRQQMSLDGNMQTMTLSPVSRDLVLVCVMWSLTNENLLKIIYSKPAELVFLALASSSLYLMTQQRLVLHGSERFSRLLMHYGPLPRLRGRSNRLPRIHRLSS